MADAPVAPALPASGTRHPVLWFVGRRIGAAILTLFIVSILIFLGTEILPGDAAHAILGRDATPAAVSQVRRELGLNRPASVRYVDWLSHIARGDLGRSATQTLATGHESPIWPLIRGRLVNTLVLALLTTILIIPLGITVGILAAKRAGRPTDQAISVTSLAAVSLPEFITGALLILVFGVWLHLLPAVSLIPSGSTVFTNPDILILPVATLLAASLAQTIRMVRAGMLEALRAEYVAMARLNGIPERTVVRRYALRNVLAPTIQVIALNVQWLVGGIIVTESVFGFPGIGQELVEVVNSRDIPFVQSVSMLIAAVYLGINILADLLVVLVTPKLRTSL
jgi:peptide/nickel transport system permease protein